MIWTRPLKRQNSKRKFFLMEQRKTESINQFAGRVKQQFKWLWALYPGRYDWSQLKEDFSRYAPLFERFYEVPLYERKMWGMRSS